MKRRSILALLGATVILAAPALAGPPLLCFPYQIGSATSLPWGDDAFKADKGYDRAHLVDDTVRLLQEQPSTLVRMETIRRAAIYVGHDHALARDLVSRMSWIAMDSEAQGKPNAQAWFDTGFAIATLRQNGAELGARPGVESNAEGFLYIKRALALDPDDDAKQFGAALVLFEHGDCKPYLKRAVAGAKPGSDLARSIESNLAFGKKLSELRAELGVDGKSSAGKSGG
jgi:hypothetical protein